MRPPARASDAPCPAISDTRTGPCAGFANGHLHLRHHIAIDALGSRRRGKGFGQHPAEVAESGFEPWQRIMQACANGVANDEKGHDAIRIDLIEANHPILDRHHLEIAASMSATAGLSKKIGRSAEVHIGMATVEPGGRSRTRNSGSSP